MSQENDSGSVARRHSDGITSRPAFLPTLAVLLALPLGLVYAAWNPPFTVPDERAHFYRSFSVSTGTCVAPRIQPIPQALTEIPNPVLPYRSDLFKAALQPRWSDGEPSRFANAAANGYTCVPYFASAAAIELGKLIRAAPLDLIYMGRLGNLAVYLCCVYLALFLAPIGRYFLFCLALMPMSLHQAASLSADGITIGTSLVLFAYVLKLGRSPERLSRLQGAALAFLLLWTTFCKFNLWLWLLVFLIPLRKFGNGKRRWAAIALILLPATLLVLLWPRINAENVNAFLQLRNLRGIFPSENLHFLVTSPLHYGAILLQTLQEAGPQYLAQFVGRSLPFEAAFPAGALVYLAILALAAISEGSGGLPRAGKILCAFLFLGSAVSIFIFLWITDTPRSTLTAARAGLSAFSTGVQGRYFIPIAPALLLVLSNSRIRMNPKVLMGICAVAVVATAGISFATLQHAYYEGQRPSTTSKPAFFSGEIEIGTNTFYLAKSGTTFGFYQWLAGSQIHHLDLGYEFVMPSQEKTPAVYLFDFKSGHWFYASLSQFPYLYDLTQKLWLRYLPEPGRPGRYTAHPRRFQNMSNGLTITM
jgi:uncharacterized membrane protein